MDSCTRLLFLPSALGKEENRTSTETVEWPLQQEALSHREAGGGGGQAGGTMAGTEQVEVQKRGEGRPVTGSWAGAGRS